MNTARKILPFLIILVLLLIIKGNISAILGSFHNENTTTNLKKQLSLQKKQNQYLKERLSYVKTDQFVREEAQDKLGLLKNGEYFVIAPTPAPFEGKSVFLDSDPNWKKWLKLFF